MVREPLSETNLMGLSVLLFRSSSEDAVRVRATEFAVLLKLALNAEPRFTVKAATVVTVRLSASDR